MSSGRVPGRPSRDAVAPTRTTWTRNAGGAILIVLALGLAFRLIIAYVIPGSGFRVDLDSFHAWAADLATNGFGGFYQRPFFHDYTPGYLYVLYVVGVVGKAAGNIGDLIKVPPILADVALGWLVWSMAREIGAGRRMALLGAALVVLNPVTWFDSVVWGQVDSFGVVFLLLGLRALWHDQPERAAILTVIAALIKPQLAILVPLVAVVTIRRALWPVHDDGDPPVPLADEGVPPPPPGSGTAFRRLRARLAAWEVRTDRPIRILTTAAAGFLTAVVLCFPFGLSVLEPGKAGSVFHSGLVEQVFKTAGGYPYASVNAYNPWALAEVDGTGVAANSGWACDTVILHPAPGQVTCPEAVMIGPLSAVTVGAILLALAFVVVCVVVARRPDRLTLLTGLTILSIAFFVLPTRVHERYLFPFIAVGAILAAFSWRWRVAYLVLSLTTFLNMYVVLTTLYPNNPKIVDWLGIGSTVRGQTSITIIAITTLAAALWAFVQLRPAAEEGLRRELAASDADDAADDAFGEVEAWRDPVIGADGSAEPGAWAGRARPADPGAGAGWAVSAARSGGASPAGPAPAAWSPSNAASGAATRAGTASGPPSWTPSPSFAELGPWGWFRAKLAERPVRADRSRGLHDEPPGRIDRLDLWLLVVLVVSILGMRMFRLSEPYQMHFDEVYHARTGTEFLQDWRYGISHEIYEYTHPHLAKYAMAGGIVAWGDDRVGATSALGVPVLDAVIEPRREDDTLPGGRAGDRVDVVTGSELRSYDLLSRRLVAAIPIAGARAVAFDPLGDQLFVGSSDGSIVSVDAVALDAVRNVSAAGAAAEPVAFGRVDGEIRRLFVPDGGLAVLAATGDDRLITLDGVSSEVLGTVQLDRIEDIAPAGTSPALVGSPGAVSDPAAAARTIAALLGGTAATYQQRLGLTTDRIVVAPISDADERAAVQKAIDDGRLAGLTIESLPQVGVADAKGLELIDPATGDLTDTVDVGGAAHGLGLTTVDDAQLYVATDPDVATHQKGRIAIVAVGGDAAKNGPALIASMAMPGPVSRVVFDGATEMVHVLGRTPDGSAATVYVIEPHARAVYADARLPIEPTALVIDAARQYPTDDREQILVFDGAGTTASVEIGQHEFAWRLPGVLAGAAMAAFLYLLARILFRRRAVAIFVGLLTFADGMFFVQSRIGMNDAYVGLGIVAAYTLFAAIWTGSWRHRGAFWIAMPLIGIFLGLALASKWVALYAIVGMGFLVLVRSAIGRLLAIAILVLMTAVLGYMAINVPQGAGFGNLPFVAIMVGLTVVAVVANVLHPVRWSLDEIRFAVGGPVALGGLIALAAIAMGKAGASLTLGPVKATPLELALGAAALGLLAWVLFVLAARLGFGPFAPAPGPDEPAALLPPPSPAPAAAWLRPGAQLGLPVAWMIGCLLILPVAVYVISYIPWAQVENHVLFAGWPPGHTGQSLTDLTGAMYAYHNSLPTPHAASSPWWAWLFDLKPVWFYQEGLAGNTTAAIYDAGNLVIWWLGLPALGFAAWQAFARRSLPLAFTSIAFALQWVSWARIDRAAFQYHYYTSLPFLILALAYFLAELWHGASRRTWLLARLSAGVAVLGPALFWVFDRPLCGFVGVTRAVADSAACPPIIPQFVLTSQTLALAVVVGLAVVVVVRLMGRLQVQELADGGEMATLGAEMNPTTRTLLLLIGTALGTILLTWLIQERLPDVSILVWNRIPVEPVALVMSIPAVLIAVFVATARDARRFVVGAVVAIVGWFVVVYPNISALPLPTAIANVYQGVLPTYLYAFQFPVNNVGANVPLQLFGPVPLLLGGSVVFLSLVVGYSAWVWRLALAEREAAERDELEVGASIGGAGLGE
ncbi:MAG TPA: phospholipid carrier-dependent glycosyltransferase [Candidatus Limnocylindrales bacterium]|nr:phospholipid carrier-dependent glycosyltransferase [Candidatus Limnocylindrales bacterium]